jgi:hypothetical protein
MSLANKRVIIFKVHSLAARLSEPFFCSFTRIKTRGRVNFSPVGLRKHCLLVSGKQANVLLPNHQINVGQNNKFSNTSVSAANGQLTATCMMTARHNLTYLLRAFEVRGDQEACRGAAKSKLCPRLDCTSSSTSNIIV